LNILAKTIVDMCQKLTENRQHRAQNTEHRTQNRASISIVDADLSTELKTIIKPMTRA